MLENTAEWWRERGIEAVNTVSMSQKSPDDSSPGPEIHTISDSDDEWDVSDNRGSADVEPDSSQA